MADSARERSVRHLRPTLSIHRHVGAAKRTLADRGRARLSCAEIVIHSATRAYRSDLTTRTEPFGPHDGAWVAVASLLEQATLVGDEERAVLLRDAVELAHEILG